MLFECFFYGDCINIFHNGESRGELRVVKNMYIDALQTDATVLNPVIFPNLGVVRYAQSF